MDDALVHRVTLHIPVCKPVLILVLMDDALVLRASFNEVKETERLNPCFNG